MSEPDIRSLALAWFERQVARAAEAHGDQWPTHREWVEEFLREEVRERLAARGSVLTVEEALRR